MFRLKKERDTSNGLKYLDKAAKAAKKNYGEESKITRELTSRYSQ